jgi:hypothetical protein
MCPPPAPLPGHLFRNRFPGEMTAPGEPPNRWVTATAAPKKGDGLVVDHVDSMAAVSSSRPLSAHHTATMIRTQSKTELHKICMPPAFHQSTCMVGSSTVHMFLTHKMANKFPFLSRKHSNILWRFFKNSVMWISTDPQGSSVFLPHPEIILNWASARKVYLIKHFFGSFKIIYRSEMF